MRECAHYRELIQNSSHMSNNVVNQRKIMTRIPSDGKWRQLYKKCFLFNKWDKAYNIINQIQDKDMTDFV